MPDDLSWLDSISLHLRHVRALDPVFLRRSDWTDWVRGNEPTWSQSGHADDLALFELERPALREALPDAAAVLASPAYCAFVANARATAEMLGSQTYQSFIAEFMAAEDALRDAKLEAERQAILAHNRLARSQADSMRCPHCSAMDLRFFDMGDHRHAYFICSGCGRSFGVDVATPSPTSGRTESQREEQEGAAESATSGETINGHGKT